MTRHTLRLLRREETQGGKPAREVTDRLREYRQLTDALAEYLRAQGADREAGRFLAEMEDRLRAGSPNLGEHLRPYLKGA
jgi:hypothetical protein